jgi:hypothetical protein
VKRDITCEEVRLGQAGLGSVRLVMHIRRGSWVMASSFHLTTSTNHWRVWDVNKYAFGGITYGTKSAKFHWNRHRNYLGTKCAQTISQSKFKLGWVKLVMRMRRGSWVMASSSFHLTNSSNRQVGITGRSKLQSTRLEQSPTAQSLYQISWKSLHLLSSD